MPAEPTGEGGGRQSTIWFRAAGRGAADEVPCTITRAGPGRCARPRRPPGRYRRQWARGRALEAAPGPERRRGRGRFGGRRPVTNGRPRAPVADVDRLLVLADVARTINDFRPLDETLNAICDRVAGLAGYRFTALV